MNRSIFVRYLLAPLVVIGVMLGFAASPIVMPAPAKASHASLITCKVMASNDRLVVSSTDPTKYLVKVFFGCISGDTTNCKIRLKWRITDTNGNWWEGTGNDISLPCASYERTVTFNPVSRTTVNGTPLPDGEYYFEYSIYRIENGQLIESDPIVDGEWYELYTQNG